MQRYSRCLLYIILACAIMEDIAWFVRSARLSYLPVISCAFVINIVRISWIIYPIRCIALPLFIDSFVVPHAKHYSLRQKVLISAGFIQCTVLFVLFMFSGSFYYSKDSLGLGMTFGRILNSCFLILCMPLSILTAIHAIKTKSLPKIVRHQLNTIVQTFLIPTFCTEFLQIVPVTGLFVPMSWVTNSYTSWGVSAILTTGMTFYCAQRIMRLRFLNLNNHVQGAYGFNFIDNFKVVLEQLSSATTIYELSLITQNLFNKAFNVPLDTVKLHLYPWGEEKLTRDSLVSAPMAVNEHKTVLIYDEVVFSNMYAMTPETIVLIDFLDTINADVCITLTINNTNVGYITIRRNARGNHLYNDRERDEMLVFAGYLANIVNLLQQRNLEHIIAREKEMMEEIYHKQQEIKQYKESIRYFLRYNHTKKIGLLLYKNRRFMCANQDASELMNVDINTHSGDPTVKACKNVVEKVVKYASAQRCITTDHNGSKIVIYGTPHVDKNCVIILMYYPEASDLITEQINRLQDPSYWDYLLYLETTETGKHINQLVPGSSEQLLNFKIDLLKTALSMKATLLDMPSDDLLPTVELLHHISMRSTLEIVQLKNNQPLDETIIRLFGINPLFDPSQHHEPLLKKLDTTGTLYIENIHFLNMEAQEMLAEYIQFGFFRVYKTNQKVFTNVRIICSTNQNLQRLAPTSFSQKLRNMLQKTSITLPPLSTLQPEAIDVLIDGFVEQALRDHTFERILELNSRDRQRIHDRCPASLHEIRTQVQDILICKSRSHDLDQEAIFDPAYEISDPQLASIARAGKHALKDVRMMRILWDKFGNQNKIAQFLGVNRSSVNRRCKHYGIG